MTTLVAWASYQNSLPSCLTIASDSRFTWGSEKIRWDCGRKTFWCKSGTEIFGYAGDVVTQSNTLSQICELVDYSTVLNDKSDADQRHAIFLKLFQSAFEAQVDVPKRGMVAFHGTRQNQPTETGRDRKSNAPPPNPFRLWKMRYDASTDTWIDEEHKFPDKIDERKIDKAMFPELALAAGTGAGAFRTRRDINFKRYGYTSRAIFSALTHAIGPDGDQRSGGPTQATSLGLNGAPKPIGFYIDGCRSVAGMQLGEIGMGGTIEWRNNDFEFIRGSDLERASGAPKYFFW